MATPPNSEQLPGEISLVTGLDGDIAFDGGDEPPEEEPEDSVGNMAMMVMAAALMGVVGSVFVAGAFLVGSTILNEMQAQGDIVVTNRDLLPGETLSSEDLVAIPGSMSNTWHSVDEIVGATVKMPIHAGDAVRLERLSIAVQGETQAMSAPEDHVWLREGKGISGLGLHVGDHVDIWSAGSTRRESIVAEDVEVLDIGRAMVGTARRITFGIPGDSGRAVEFARESGRLHLALRAVPEPKGDLSEWDVEVPVQPVDAEGPSQLHLVAAVAAGQPLEHRHFAPRMGNALSVGAFTNPEDVVGRIAAELILPGEVLTESKLTNANVGRGLSSMMKPNQRGVALSIGDAPPNALPPGSWLTIQNLEDGEADAVLAERVEVIGLSANGIGCPCIVLGVDESDVGLILQSQAVGTLGVGFADKE